LPRAESVREQHIGKIERGGSAADCANDVLPHYYSWRLKYPTSTKAPQTCTTGRLPQKDTWLHLVCMKFTQKDLVSDNDAPTVPQELYLIGDTCDFSPLGYTGMVPMDLVEAYCPSSLSMRQVVQDPAPRSLAAASALGRGICVCGGTTQVNCGEAWLNTCTYLDIDGNVGSILCKPVRTSSRENDTDLCYHWYSESAIGRPSAVVPHQQYYHY
jgi:hypothetical protein